VLPGSCRAGAPGARAWRRNRRPARRCQFGHQLERPL